VPDNASPLAVWRKNFIQIQYSQTDQNQGITASAGGDFALSLPAVSTALTW
jgi:hypothetical protein